MLLRIAALAVCACGWVLLRVEIAASQTRPPVQLEAGEMEVSFTDNTTLRVQLVETSLRLDTPHGALNFPAGDLKRIEFATRIPEELQLSVNQALADLGGEDFPKREAAMAKLLSLKRAAYPSLKRASQQGDLELRTRAQQLVDKLEEELSEDELNVRAYDYVSTAESRIAGKLPAVSLKVLTKQFGPLEMKLADVREIRLAGFSPTEETGSKEILPDPGNLTGHESEIGKTIYFQVTGAIGGSIYGTNVYTTDTTLAAAAVHSGVLKVGETAVVRVDMLPTPPSFTGSTSNGITSNGWGAYRAAYSLKKTRLKPPQPKAGIVSPAIPAGLERLGLPR